MLAGPLPSRAMGAAFMAKTNPPSTPPYTTAVKADAPVAWWKLKTAKGATTVLDASGHGFTAVAEGTFATHLGATGTPAPAPPTGIGGPFYYFSAYTAPWKSYAAFVASASLLAALQDHDFTIEAWLWFKPTYSSRRYGVLEMRPVSSTQSSVYGLVVYAGGSSYITLDNNSTSLWAVTTQAWKYVAMTYTAATKTITGWVNAVKTHAKTVTPAIDVTTVTWALAGAKRTGTPATYDKTWQGGLAQVAVYDKVLAATRIAAHYAAGK